MWIGVIASTCCGSILMKVQYQVENASVGLSTRRTALLELALAHCGRDRVVGTRRGGPSTVGDRVSEERRPLPVLRAEACSGPRRNYGPPWSTSRPVAGDAEAAIAGADAGARGVAAGGGRGRRGGVRPGLSFLCVDTVLGLACDGAGTSHVTSPTNGGGGVATARLETT